MANHPRPTRVLITAGPTHEPIDSVRYLANRSSGTLGLALGKHAALRGFETRVLLGPVPGEGRPHPDGIEISPFTTTADLEALLAEHAPWADLIIMAAAVADFRPAKTPSLSPTKLRRTESGLSLDLEPTPDLIAQVASRRRPGQVIVGFALEPANRLEASALDKLRRKDLDFIVANPLETMDSPDIEATLFARDTRCDSDSAVSSPGKVSKDTFARWLLDQLIPLSPTTQPGARTDASP